ncbi:MAG TPA: alpha/beta hydrolase [Lactobacillaceae bacterium]|jgi:pimeloyl-ACP methyl ester carboxylesterase
MTKTILFIHGAWMTPASWQAMRTDFEALGYKTLAPAWPYHEATILEQRTQPDQRLTKIGLAELVKHYANIIAGLPEQPILVGHSFGGLLVQLLLDKGYGAAGIAIDSAAPKGILAAAYPSAVRSSAAVLLRPWHRLNLPTPAQFNYAFANGLTDAEQRNAYTYAVPETTSIFFQLVAATFQPNSPATVNFDNLNRAPLLLIAGENDHIVPPKMVQANFHKYNKKTDTTMISFPNRTHWIIGQTGHEAVSQAIHKWLIVR